MPELPESLPCPSCGGGLIPRVLECNTCGTRVETRGSNEFAHLDDETLHMLRIFVRCEGRIRDMEAALGVSYPTVKSRLARLREQVSTNIEAGEAAPAANDTSQLKGQPARTASEVLDALDRDEVDYETALAQLKALKKG